eukprot:g13216.t1
MRQGDDIIYRESYRINADIRDKYDGGIDPPDDLRFSIGSGFAFSIDPNSPTTAGIINSSAASPTAPEGISGDPVVMESQEGGKHAPRTPTSRLRRSVGPQDSPKAGFSPLMGASLPLMFAPSIFNGGIEPIPLPRSRQPRGRSIHCVQEAFDGLSGHDDGHPLRQQHAEAANPVEATRVHLITLLEKAKKVMAMKMLEIIDGTTAVEPGSAGRGRSPIGGGGPVSPLDVDAFPSRGNRSTLTAVAPINADVVTPTNAAAGHDELISKFAATQRAWISTAVVDSVHDLVSPAAAAAATTDAISASDEPISTFNPTPRAGVSTPVGSSVLDLVSPAVTADAAPAAGSLVAAELSTTIKVAHKNHSGAPVLPMKKSPTTSTTPARRAPFTAAAYVNPISRTVAPPSTPSFLHTKTLRTPSSSGSVNMGKKPPPMRFGGAGEAMSSPPRTLPGGSTPRKASIDAGAAPDRAASVIADTHRLCRGGDGERRRRRVPRGSTSTGAVEHTREQAGGGVDDAGGDERHRQGERTSRTAQSPDLLHSRGSKTLTNVRELLDAKTAVVEEDNAEAAKEGAAKVAVAKVQKFAAKAARDARASNRAALKDNTWREHQNPPQQGVLPHRGRHVGDQRPSEMEETKKEAVCGSPKNGT